MSAPKVLIVDDNAMNVALVTFLLEADHITVASVPDVAAARISIAQFAPDLILMDIQLPDVDGLTFTQELKRAQQTRDIAVVAFTAYAMKGDEARMLAAGCDGYLAKPIDVSRFTAQIRSHLPAR